MLRTDSKLNLNVVQLFSTNFGISGYIFFQNSNVLMHFMA